MGIVVRRALSRTTPDRAVMARRRLVGGGLGGRGSGSGPVRPAETPAQGRGCGSCDDTAASRNDGVDGEGGPGARDGDGRVNDRRPRGGQLHRPCGSVADGRRSGSRVRGRNACWAAGTARRRRRAAPSSASSGGVAVSVRTRAAIAPTTAPRTMWAVSIRPRDGRRSASTPDGARHGAARRSRSSTVPSARPSRQRITSHDRAMNWNWSPTTRSLRCPRAGWKSRARARRNGGLRTRPIGSAVIRGRSARRRRRRRPRAPTRGTRNAAPRGRARPARRAGPGCDRGRTFRRRSAGAG